MATEIEFLVDVEGNTTFEVSGMRGKGCAEVADQFAKALGKKVKEKLKREYYEQPIEQKQKVVRGGF